MLYTSCILQTRWGFCDYRSQIHEQYAIICRVTFSIVNYEFAHTTNGRTKILFFGICLTSRINPYDQDGILGRFSTWITQENNDIRLSSNNWQDN